MKSLVATTFVALSAVLVTAPGAQALQSNTTDSFPDFNSTVRTVTHVGSTIYVGGDFTSVTDSTGTLTRNHVAAIDANTGQVLPWNPDVDGTVYKIAAKPEGVYIVGDFATVNGTARTDIARVSPTGTVDRTFRHRTNGAVTALTFSKTNVYLGGTYTSFDGVYRDHLAAVARTGSSKKPHWFPSATGGYVDALRFVRHSGVFVGGGFTALNGSKRHARFGLVSPTTGATVATFRSHAPRPVLDVVVRRKKVYAAMGGIGGGELGTYSRTNGAVISRRRFDGDVQTLTVLHKRILIGGHFTGACATATAKAPGRCLKTDFVARKRGAAVGGASGRLLAWDPGFNAGYGAALGVRALDVDPTNNRVFAGGGFTESHGVQDEAFAVFGK